MLITLFERCDRGMIHRERMHQKQKKNKQQQQINSAFRCALENQAPIQLNEMSMQQ